MSRPDDALRALGRELGAAQDEQIASLGADLAEARADRVAALVAEDEEAAEREALRGRRTARRYLPLAVAAVAALAAGVALGAVLGLQWGGGDDDPAPDDSPLTFVTGDDRAPGVIGTSYEAAPGIERLLRFTDGTELRLGGRPGGRVRVESVDRAGARVVLEEGGVSAAVVPLEGARWTVRAGPFDVHVVGTRFRVEWTPRASVFRLVLEEGAVILSGPLLGEGRRVLAGESVLVNLVAGTVLVETLPARAAGPSDLAPLASDPAATADPIAPAAPAAMVAASGAAPRTATAGAAPSKGKTAAPATAAAPDWRALLADRRYREALAAARAIGLVHLASTSDAETLLLLADAARFAKDPDAATVAYTAIRARFPGHPHARDAAWHLGRVAHDTSRDARVATVAARWLQTYLTESPDGAYAREAAGRLIEALELAGDFPGARAAAASYLARFPGGPHTAVARGVLARGPMGTGAAAAPHSAAGSRPTAAPTAAPR